MTSRTLIAALVIYLCCLAWLGDAEAACDDELTVGSMISSNHFHSDEPYNESQFPSLYVNCDGWLLGFYENSFSNQDYVSERLYSVFMGYEAVFADYDHVDWSVSVGAVNGYPKEWAFDFETEKYQVVEKEWLGWVSVGMTVADTVKIWVIPGYLRGNNQPLVIGVVGASLEYRFW